MLADTLVALIAASAFLASAGPVPREVLEAKDVGVLTCESAYTGPLVYILGTDNGPLSFVGPKSSGGLPILHTKRASGEKVPSHSFTFKLCKSDKDQPFMGSPPAGYLGLGHLELTAVPGKCVTANLAGRAQDKKHTNFLLDDCSLSDDSGQLLQTFALSKKGYADFLGHREGETPDYQLSLSKLEYANVLLEKVNTPGGGLRFKFSNE